MSSDIQILDSYAGMGGFGTGFGKFFDVTDAVDNWKDACMTYKYNHPNTKVNHRDFWEYVQSELVPRDFDGIIDVPTAKKNFAGVVGGPPCQEFSVLNRWKNYNSPRANQVIVFTESVILLRPKFAMMENVARIPAELKERVAKKLRDAGYKVTSRVVYASNYGSIQKRRRWILTAHEDRHVFPEPRNYSRKASEILIKNETSEFKLTDRVKNELKNLPTGKWVALPGHKWKEYYIVDPNKLLPAIVNVTKNMIIAPDRSRKLSFREICQCQGFTADYKMYGGKGSKAQQLANAVPVELSTSFALKFFKIFHPNKDVSRLLSESPLLNKRTNKVITDFIK